MLIREVQAGDGALVIDEQTDVAFSHPEFLQFVEILIVGESFGEVNRIDATGGSSGENINHEARVHGAFGDARVDDVGTFDLCIGVDLFTKFPEQLRIGKQTTQASINSFSAF